jgi:hypothetical protein
MRIDPLTVVPDKKQRSTPLSKKPDLLGHQVLSFINEERVVSRQASFINQVKRPSGENCLPLG